MSYNPNNANGQATMANSAPVVVASDQSPIPVSDNGGSITVDGTVAVSGTVPVSDNGGSLTVDGSVSVSNFPATQPVSGTVTVEDGGGSITVDGTVAATQSGAWDTRTQDGVGNDITSHSAGASRGIDVAIIDGSGNQITSFGGGTQYAEGATVATATGTVSLMKDDADLVSPMKGDFTDGLLVNLGANNDIAMPYGMIDTFGKLMTSTSRNDIDVQFYRDDPNNILTVTSTGGGAASSQTGYAQFTSSTSTTGSVKGVSLDKTHYHSGGEIYAMFAAAFLDGGVATSSQRIGLFDDNNGFYVGFENTTFGVTVRDGGSNNFISSFNSDALDGGSSSKFTRNGVPEAIDLTKLNVFRVRFGWLGAASVKFEVMSPDENWVLFHVIKQPNLSNTPHIETADLPMTLHIAKTAGSTNIRINTTCWGGGIQYSNMDWSESSTLSTTVGSIVDYNTSGLGSAIIYCGTSTTGAFTIETTVDGKNWFTHPIVVSPTLQGSAILTEGAITPVSGDYFKIAMTGFRGLRARTTSTLGASVILSFVGDTHDAVFNMNPAPHNIGYVTVHKDGEYTTQQTGVTLWQPATGKKICVTDFTISVGGTTSGTVTVWQGSSADTTYTVGTDPALFRGDFTPTTSSSPGISKTFTVPFCTSTAGHYIRVTTSAAMTVYIQLNGYEL